MKIQISKLQAAPRIVDLATSVSTRLSFSFIEGSGTVDVKYSIAGSQPVRFLHDGMPTREFTDSGVSIGLAEVDRTVTLCATENEGEPLPVITVVILKDGETKDLRRVRIALTSLAAARCA